MATERQPVTLTDAELIATLRTWASNRRRAGIGLRDCDLLDEAADRLERICIVDLSHTPILGEELLKCT